MVDERERRQHGRRDIVRIRCQAETGKDTEDLATTSIVVRSRMCELARALQFFTVTSFRSPVTCPDSYLVTKHVTTYYNKLWLYYLDAKRDDHLLYGTEIKSRIFKK